MNAHFDGADSVFAPRTSCPTSSHARTLLAVFGLQVVFVLGLLLLGHELGTALTAAGVLLVLDLLALRMTAEGLRKLLRKLGGPGESGPMLAGWN